jgi:hypothetical protein
MAARYQLHSNRTTNFGGEINFSPDFHAKSIPHAGRIKIQILPVPDVD